MTLPLLAVLIQAAKAPALFAFHAHEGWILKDTTACPRCQAEAAVLAAARQFQQAATPVEGAP